MLQSLMAQLASDCTAAQTEMDKRFYGNKR